MTDRFRSASVRRALAALAVASTFAAGAAQATPDARNAAEIDFLLNTIGTSSCTFIRSGQEYSGPEARKHLEMKLGFVRWRLQTTEQFIDKLASSSSTTGEAYQIRCAGNQTAAHAWLESQLKLVRGQH